MKVRKHGIELNISTLVATIRGVGNKRAVTSRDVLATTIVWTSFTTAPNIVLMVLRFRTLQWKYITYEIK